MAGFIPESECVFTFARSGGKGGQNVNKVSTKAVLRWNPALSAVLSAEEKALLLRVLASRLTEEGELVITAQDTRSQDQNREEALRKLREIIRAALIRPKKRRPTRPGKGARERRISAKKHHGARKQQRGKGNWD